MKNSKASNSKVFQENSEQYEVQYLDVISDSLAADHSSSPLLTKAILRPVDEQTSSKQEAKSERKTDLVAEIELEQKGAKEVKSGPNSSRINDFDGSADVSCWIAFALGIFALGIMIPALIFEVDVLLLLGLLFTAVAILYCIYAVLLCAFHYTDQSFFAFIGLGLSLISGLLFYLFSILYW